MSRTLSAATLALSLSLLAWTPGPVHAQAAADATQVSPAVAQEAQKLVRAQLDAFAANDAEQAFSYASASIRQMFGTAAQFVRMVRGSYPVVYRPAAVVFLKPTTTDGALVQPVHMTDREGVTWLALYSLQRQSDDTWRIGGCVLVPHAGKTA
jgi:hypothetical protein